MNIFKLFLVTVLFAGSAMASEHNHRVVKDSSYNIIKNTFENCVYTKWTSTDGSECSGSSMATSSDAPLPESRKEEILEKAGFSGKEARTIYFDFNSSNIKESEKAKLDKLISKLEGNKVVKSASIYGYADKIGSSEYNKNLSKKRANAVRDYFKAKGYLKTNVDLKAFGKEKPTTNCDKVKDKSKLISCLADDRKVEIDLNIE